MPLLSRRAGGREHVPKSPLLNTFGMFLFAMAVWSDAQVAYPAPYILWGLYHFQHLVQPFVRDHVEGLFVVDPGHRQVPLGLPHVEKEENGLAKG